METVGRHLLVDYRGCQRAVLDDPAALELLMRAAAAAARATVLAAQFHRFRPHGVSGFLLIAESHLSLHTWPEEGYAAIDFYTCGGCDPTAAHEVLARGLAATTSEPVLVERGLDAGRMQVTRQASRVSGSAPSGTATQGKHVPGGAG